MKIKPEHFEKLVSGLAQIKPEIAIPEYKAKNLSEARWKWDAFWASKIDGNSNAWQCKTLYPYLNDTHLETALNAAFRKLNLTYKEK